MFLSSDSNGSSDCFGAHSGFISPSSFQQFGSSSSPAFLEEDDHFFVTAHIFAAMFQGHQSFLLGHDEVNTNQLALTDNHGFVDHGVMVAGSCNEQMSYDKAVGEEEVGFSGKNQQKAAIGGSSNDDQTNEKDCEPVKRQAYKRISTGKKERHSKISTAKGLRDRRMRLSLQIARKFFDLQDKLGFDKASKTIEWLFSMSKNAIREVMGYSRMDEHGTNNNPSDNVCKKHLVPRSELYEDGSLDDIAINNHKTYNYEDCTTRVISKHCRSTNKDKLRSTRVPKWSQMRKDVRDKARARARERTSEKMSLKALKDPNHASLTTSSEKTATANPSYQHYCFSEQIGTCSAIEHVDSSAAQSQSVELIHAGWEEIEDARLYSCYMFQDTTQQHQDDVLCSIRYQS